MSRGFTRDGASTHRRLQFFAYQQYRQRASSVFSQDSPALYHLNTITVPCSPPVLPRKFRRRGSSGRLCGNRGADLLTNCVCPCVAAHWRIKEVQHLDLRLARRPR
jgi:hypothetical protein